MPAKTPPELAGGTPALLGAGLRPAPGTRLWLVRHAEVEERYHWVFGGRMDIELSPRGHEQAAALAGYLGQRSFAAIYASPMKRVQQTLAPLMANGAPRPVVLQGLREVDVGDWTGLSWDEVRSKFGVSAFHWLDQIESDSIPNGEGARALQARLEPCLRRIFQNHAGQRVAIFCHGGVIRMLLAMLLVFPLSKMAAFEIGYASITEVVFRPHRACVELLNFTPWRELAA
ncbi:MAG: hypothetical protein DME25_07455 [Verrucomicrobia bacterium]|nr:MAG: hypothetical protein DME25_07455 [Verrucomicrobiota bacterium]